MNSRTLRPVLPRLLLVLAAVVLAGVATPPAARAEGPSWWWALDPRPDVVGPYEAPAGPYAAGHRGVDLAAPAGAVVRAVDGGVVAFAGRVAGVAVVSVQHEGVRSTYQPVEAVVGRGDRVERGAVLGRLLLAGGHCHPRACLHLGLRHGETYADPLALLTGGAGVRLVAPYGSPPVPPPTRAPSVPVPGLGGLVMPVDAPVSSPFGMRVHPVTGVLKLHDGTDFAAPCGTPVRAAADGTVVAATYDPAYGRRVVLDHGGGFVTSYNHLTSYEVAVGDAVPAAAVVGAVGTTGLSTGCHLHFMVEVDGVPVDPLGFA